jgi:hypothetical protein
MKKVGAIVVALSLVLGTVGVGDVQAVQYPEDWEIRAYAAGGFVVGAAALARAGNRGKKFLNFVLDEAVLCAGIAAKYLSKKAADAYDYCSETEILTREDGSKFAWYKHGRTLDVLTGIGLGIVARMSVALGINVVGLFQRGRNVAAGVAAVGAAAAVAAGAGGAMYAYRMRPAI